MVNAWQRLALAATLAGCATPDPTTPRPAPNDEEAHLVPLAPARLLRRMSLDLRGVLPSPAELDAVEADAGAFDRLRDAWLDDPRLEERVVEWLAERWHTRVDSFDIRHYDYGLADTEEFAFEKAVGEEPLRLAARVVITDAPWSTIVTADHTMANELLAELWPLDYPAGAEGWQEARYTDGRPPVGVLATNGLWWRYPTSSFNLSRSRVGALSRLLVCHDLLERPISFTATPSLLDPEGVADAITTVDACVSCHSGIEPAAAAMFGFVPAVQYNVDEVERYHPEREPLGPLTLGVAPAWYGRPISGLAELGPAIAADPRFDACAVETFASALWRREVDVGDTHRLATLRSAYDAGGERIRPLLRAILDGATWQAGALADEAEDAEATKERTARLLSPDQLARVIEDLTAFRWTESGFDQLRNDERGYRVLAGGVNGVNVLRPQATPGLTWALVVRRLAEGGAATVVANDLGGGARRLLTVSGDERPGELAFDAELDTLSWRLFAERADAEDRATWSALWTTVEAGEGPEAAWTAVLAALLQDPAFVTE